MAVTNSKKSTASLLLQKLQSDLDDPKWTSAEKLQQLEQLKILGRDVKSAEPIFTRNAIKILATIGFEEGETAVSQEALRCLANALLLNADTRQYLVELGFAEKAAKRFNSDDINDEFLVGRILILLTYNTNLDFIRLLESSQLANKINVSLIRHRDLRFKNGGSPTPAPQVEEMAFCEVLKLIFNLTKLYSGSVESFNTTVPVIFQILGHEEIPNKPLEPPLNHLLNALLNLDLKLSDHIAAHVLTNQDLQDAVKKTIRILDAATVAYPEDELDNHIASVITILRNIYQVAPKEIQEYLESALLPGDAERQQPIGKSDTLSSKLLKFTTSALTPKLRDLIPLTLLELSGNDTMKFIKNIGYGYASGFLMRNNIPIPDDFTKKNAGNSREETLINPVTGQRLDAEPEEVGPPMTNEEKEREAERLFVLIERLKKTGVVNIKNPVEQAVEEGRFEELD